MSRYYAQDSDHEHQPLTWWGAYPIYAAYFLVIVFVVSYIATALAMGPLHVGSFVMRWLVFDGDEVLHGQVWRLLTYGLINIPSPDFGFVFDMFMIGWFGRELEKFFGRSLFLRFYACIYFLPPLAFTLLSIWWPLPVMAGEVGAFSIFIAFATLYPNVPVLFNILAKWLAIILVGVYTLVDITHNDLVALATLWITVSFAFCFVRYEQGRITLPSFRFWKRKPKLRVLPDLPEKKSERVARPEPVATPDASMAEIDALLDKIAQSGLGSLTAKERAKLEKGREKLLKKESRR